MPPKAKFTREEIVQSALQIVRREGMQALTARLLGKELGSSARPVFTVFHGMEEVEAETVKQAKALYASYVEEALAQTEMPAFKSVGLQYVLFAIREPKLFQLLFMTEQKENLSVYAVLPVIEENYNKILRSVQEGYGIDEKQSEALYRHLWIYTHGIAVLCATKLCALTEKEIGCLLSEACRGFLREIREGTNADSHKIFRS